MPPVPERCLHTWRFNGSNDWSPPSLSPLAVVNVQFAESWSGYALSVEGPPPRLLCLPAVRADGRPLITWDTGTVRFWFRPSWSSASLGGSGPGSFARLVELGAWTPDARVGWWALYLDPEGSALAFSSQGGGRTLDYLKAPIEWRVGDWHHIALVYAANGSALYIDGALAAQGPAVSSGPSRAVVAEHGFTVGSDFAGENVAQGQFEELTTFAYPCSPEDIAWNYQSLLPSALLGPITPEEEAQRWTWLLAARQAAGSRMTSLLDEGEPPPEQCPEPKITATRLTNGTLRLDLCGMQSGYKYDLLVATNLGTRHDGADIDWLPVQEFQQFPTNTIVTPSDGQAFYRVVRLFDPDALPAPSLYVSAGAPAGGDGSKDLPFRDLRSALNLATNNSLIQVLPGVYSGSSNYNLTVTNKVVLISERGWEQTVIDCGHVANSQAFRFTTSNATPQEAVLVGFTISNAASSAILCTGGSRPTFINCAFLDNALVYPVSVGAVFCDNASPTFINCRFARNSTPGAGAAIYARGGNSHLSVSHCTISDNTHASNGGQVFATNNCVVTLVNTIVWSSATNTGPEIVSGGGALVRPTYCDIDGWTNGGLGNISKNPRFETGGTLRLRTNSFCIDQGTTNTVPGFRVFTQTDMDGEARLDHATNNVISTTDIGADEFVYRLQFPTVTSIKWVIGANGLYVAQTNIVSEVDEASGVAYLTNNGTGPIISVVDDEDRTGFRLYQLNADASAITQSIPVDTRNLSYTNSGDQEIADMEGLTYDAANRHLYLITSQTKRNRYRDVDSTPPILDGLVDPPSSDYDRRRSVLAQVALDANLTNITARTFFESEVLDAPYNTKHLATHGLAALLWQRLTNNPALWETNRGNKVLIAWNTTNKFGTPVKGEIYLTNSLLPYTNGGLYTNAGISLGFFNANGPAVGTNTHTGRTAGVAYYYKIWAVDAMTNYYEGPTVGVTNNGIPRIYINEFDAAGNNETVELYNPSPVAVSIAGCYLSDDPSLSQDHFYRIPSNTTIPARGVWTVNSDAWGRIWGWADSGDEHVYLFWTNGTATSLDIWNMEDPDPPGVEFTQGRVWDGGPRGFISLGTDFESCKYEVRTPASPYPTNLGTLNLTNAYKRFDAVADGDPTKIHLVWQHIGLLPAVSAYSPKQHDFHAINIEDIAFRSASEVILGLRAPLLDRTSSNAYYFKINDLAAFLGTPPWPAANQMQGISNARQMDLGGLGIRSIKWCPNGLTDTNGQGVQRYLVLAGTANGGPIQRENARQRFSLYAWNGIATGGLAQPQLLIADLQGYTVRPEGVELINVNGQWRILFVEDRFQSTGYATRNAIHWPVSILGNIQ